MSGGSYSGLTPSAAGQVIQRQWGLDVRDSVVTVHASASARASAISAPTEGMVTYLSDSDTLWTYSGAAWVPAAGAFGVASMRADGSADSTTSASYVNLAGTSSVSFTKAFDATRVLVDLVATFYSTGLNTRAAFGVGINGTDYDLAKMIADATNTRVTAAGGRHLTSGVGPAGTYTCQIKWLRTNGAGTLTRNTDDFVSLRVQEIV